MVIRRIRSDDYNLDIQIVDEDLEPINLSGCTVFFTVKRRLQDSDSNALISVDTTSHPDPTNGITSIPLTASECDLVGDFHYDVKIKYSTGVIQSVIKDMITFIDHVTIRTS